MLTISNIHGTMVEQFHSAADHIGLDINILRILGKSMNEITFNFPVQMESGNVEILSGYRVQHNNIRGPFIGGLRIHPSVNLTQMKALASWNTWKATLLDIPFGGAMGGIAASPGEFSGVDLEHVIRRYTYAVRSNIDPEYDVITPDINSNPRIMSWILDSYLTEVPRDQINRYRHVVTGKPETLGGLPNYNKLLAKSIMFLINVWCDNKGLDAKGMTYSLQGFGKIGSNLAKLLSDAEHLLVAIEDSGGAFRDKDGIDVSELLNYKKKFGRISGYPRGERISHEDFLQTGVDMMIFAALEHQVDGTNAKSVNTKLIVEAASAPVDTEADIILEDRGIDIIPDIISDSGSLVLSYFEWLQNKRCEKFEADELESMLKKKMLAAYKIVEDAAEEYETTHRNAAYIKALSILEKIYKSKGVFP